MKSYNNSNEVIQKKTGELTANNFPFPINLNSGERRAFFWCDMTCNEDVIKAPFEIILEYDNPNFKCRYIPFIKFLNKKRLTKATKYNFSAYRAAWGVNGKYDIHNVAKELSRIREQLEKSKRRSIRRV